MMQPQRTRIVRRAVHGVLLLDKPLGASSNDALQQAKRLYRAEKAGHTGTLDPLATGLLPLCFGAATKFSQVSLDADKRYLATLQLGITTTTADAEGAVVETRDVEVSRAQFEAACARFTGPIDQVPPMHSALKRGGRALYEYARAGIEIEREARRVTIHRIDIAEVDHRGHPQGDHDRWTIDVQCSKGTYIRTLAEDIGRLLGCGAHLAALRRIGSGELNLDRAVTLERLAAMTESERDAALLAADALVAEWPAVCLDAEDAGRFLSGVRRRSKLPDAPQVRVYGPALLASPGGPALQPSPGGTALQAGPGGQAPRAVPGSPEPRAFLGSGHIKAGELISTRLLSPVEVQGLLTSAVRTDAAADLLSPQTVPPEQQQAREKATAP